VETPAYIIVNLLLFSSWFVLLFQKKESLSFTDRIIGTFVLCLTQIMATEMLLGVVFKKLHSHPLFFLNISISLVILLFTVYSRKESGVLTEIKNEIPRFFRTVREDGVLFCIFCLFAVSLFWLSLLGYLFPSYSWDALYYHLPMIGQIIQSGAIQENPTPSFIQQFINIFPKNINLFFIWNIIFLKKDTIVDLSQLFFTIAGVFTVYSICIKLNIKERFAVYSSLLFFFTPVLILQSTVNYVDGAVSVLFLIAVNFLMYNDPEHCVDKKASLIPSKKKKSSLLLAGLSSGILLGSKPTSPLFLMVLTGAIVIQECLKHSGLFKIARENNRYVLRDSLKTYLFYFILPALFLGGYWYARNWVFYGNPLYYMDISIFNITLFKGLRQDWVEPAPAIINNLTYLTKLFYVWLERVEYYLYDSRLSGFGPVWFILFLPAIVFSLIYAAGKKKYSFLFISVVLVVTFLLHPRNWTTRYVIFIVGLGAMSYGLLCDYLHEKSAPLRIMALVLVLYTFLTSNSPCIMPAKVKEFLSLPPAERTLSRHKPFNIDIKVRDEYGHWIWIGNNISGDDTLAYTFERKTLDTSRPFFLAPLWNREFSNRVIYVKSEDYNQWLTDLEKQNVTYVLIKQTSEEDKWIEKMRNIRQNAPAWLGIRERFRLVYSDDKYKILKLGSSLERT
jgi:hypothetical protein